MEQRLGLASAEHRLALREPLAPGDGARNPFGKGGGRSPTTAVDGGGDRPLRATDPDTTRLRPE
jgi:hypothetical protein